MAEKSEPVFADAKTDPVSEFLSYAELTVALHRCLEAHPPAGEERAMHPDADRMAHLWAVMTVERQQQVRRASVDPRVLDALRLWSVQP